MTMTDMENKKEQEMMDALHELRCIVLMECEGGHFHQVMLNQEEYKAMNNSISRLTKNEEGPLKERYELREMHIKHGWEIPADTLIGLQSCYTFREIAEDEKKLRDKEDI